MLIDDPLNARQHFPPSFFTLDLKPEPYTFVERFVLIILLIVKHIRRNTESIDNFFKQYFFVNLFTHGFDFA